MTGAEVVSKLNELGFFSLTDSIYLDSAKKSYEESYNDRHYLGGELISETIQFSDNRFYFVDGEALFEIGGLTEYLDIVKVSFDKLNLKLEYSDEISDHEGNFWNHTIKLNGKEYIAFRGEFSYKDWGIALANFVKMLNDQLEIQQSDERFYPINGGNDGQVVLLSKQQFEFIRTVYPNNDDHPQTLEEWQEKNQIPK
jgi:hypothetical protein